MSPGHISNRTLSSSPNSRSRSRCRSLICSSTIAGFEPPKGGAGFAFAGSGSGYASARMVSAAVRYFSMFEGESVSTEPMRSKPCHSGSSSSAPGSFASYSTPIRSRTVLTYSSRVRRLKLTRPRAAMRAASPSFIRAAIHSTILALSSALGRTFASSGGISPELMRSMISSHCGVFSVPTFGERLSTRKSPFCTSAL